MGRRQRGLWLAQGGMCVLLAGCAAGSANAAGGTAASGTGPPPVTVLTPGADNGNGDIFLAPQSGGSYASGPEIVSDTGKLIWFHALPPGTAVSDFRTQTYLGKPVLTWFQSSGDPASGEDVIYDDHYRQIATIKPGNGL